MRTGIIAAMVVPVLALAACASQSTQTSAPAPTAAPQVASPTASGSSAKKADQDANGTKVNARVGNFRRTTKNGQTLYCEKAEFVGSKMTKTRCLTEGEFATLQERNAEMIEDLNRAQSSSQPVNDLPSQPQVPY